MAMSHLSIYREVVIIHARFLNIFFGYNDNMLLILLDEFGLIDGITIYQIIQMIPEEVMKYRFKKRLVLLTLVLVPILELLVEA